MTSGVLEQYPTKLQAAHAFAVLGMRPTQEHPTGHDISEPKIVDLSNLNKYPSPNIRSRLADQAYKSMQYLYSDTQIPQILSEQYGHRADRRIVGSALPDLSRQAIANGATQFITQCYLPSCPEAGQPTFAIWDNGPEYGDATLLRQAYMQDPEYHIYRGRRHQNNPPRDIDGHCASWPTAAIDTVVAEYSGSVTVASGSNMLTISPAGTETEVFAEKRRRIPKIIGNIAIVRLPNSTNLAG